MHHFRTRIQQRVVHVDVYHQRTVLHLLAGYQHRFVVLLFLDETQKLPAARHIAAFTDVRERARPDFEHLQTAELHPFGLV